MSRTICLGACLIGFGLRLALLATQPIWWDEAISLHLAESPAAAIIADRAANIHPPLYFLVLRGWVSVAGATVFAARFFSAWFGVLTIAAAGTVARRLLGAAEGIAAAALVATSAAFVVYSQEARVYAILPLVYVATLGCVERLTAMRGAVARRQGWLKWAFLVLLQAAGLHLHYTFAIAVGYVNSVLPLRMRRQRAALRWWLGSVIALGLLCLPWALVVMVQPGGVRAGPRILNPFAEAVPLGYLAELVWTFQWTGLTGAMGSQVLRVSSSLVAALLALAVAMAGVSRAAFRRLAGHWITPVVPAAILWMARPFAHPRYILTFSVALFLLIGAVFVNLWRRSIAQRVLGVALGSVVAVTTAAALGAWYCDPAFAKDDTRGLAAWLEHQGSRSLIVAPHGDWTLDYAEALGPERRSRILRPDPSEPSAFWSTLAQATQGTPQAILISYPRDERDRRGVVEFALESSGSLVGTHSVKGIQARVYDLTRAISRPPRGKPLDARFGPLTLASIWIEPEPPAGTAIALATDWSLLAPTSERYRATLRLHDADGHIWRATDDWLLDGQGRPTDEWQPGSRQTNFHVLPVPPGLPPVTYTVSAGVYSVGADDELVPVDLVDAGGNPTGYYVALGCTVLRPNPDRAGDPYGSAPELAPLGESGDLGGGVVLEASSLDRPTVRAGESLYVILRWRSEEGIAPGARPVLRLEMGNDVLNEIAALSERAGYPLEAWRPGEPILERRRIGVPAGSPSGSARVSFEVDGRRVVLGQIEIRSSVPVFEPPAMGHRLHIVFGEAAELMGYDIEPGPYTANGPIVLTLYWRAMPDAAEGDYAVFAHLLGTDGRLVGQHDGIPAGGARPTLGWVQGEIIVDVHPMAFREAYTGPATVVVGLYDPNTMERLLTTDGADAYRLPETLTIALP